MPALVSVFATLLVAHAARVRRESDQTLSIAGVPVKNYAGSKSSASNREDWIVVLKNKATAADVERMCTIKNKNHCNIKPDMKTRGVKFLQVSAKRSDLERVLDSKAAKYMEPDLIQEEMLDDQHQQEGGAYEPGPYWGMDRIGRSQTQNRGKDTHVYVIDTGIRYQHADFGGRAKPAVGLGPDFLTRILCNGTAGCADDDRGHGTHCAGTVGGLASGLASEATLYGVKVLNYQGSGYTSVIAEGIEWVSANHTKPAVASLSLGGPGTSPLYLSVLNEAMDNGVIVVVAAGNSYMDACNFSPAYIPRAITVGSTEINDERSWFSNFGSCIDILAPGSSILSASHTGDTEFTVKSGTSMACPAVAGSAALLLAKNPSLGQDGIIQKLLENAEDGAIAWTQEGTPNKFLWVGDVPPPARARFDCSERQCSAIFRSNPTFCNEIPQCEGCCKEY